MSNQKFNSLQDIIKHRQQEEFVGREEQLGFFRRNLHLAPENPSSSTIPTWSAGKPCSTNSTSSRLSGLRTSNYVTPIFWPMRQIHQWARDRISSLTSS